MQPSRLASLLTASVAVLAVLAVAGSSGAATFVPASGARARAATTAIVLAPNAPAPTVSQELFALDPSPDDAAAAPGGVAQTVSVSVEPGPLVVLDGTRAFTLTRIPGSTTYRASIPAFRVVDARGSLVGWRFSVRPEIALPGGRGTLRVRVTRISVFASSIDGVRAFDADVEPGRTATVASAASGNSGGTFDVALTITWAGPSDGPAHVDGTLVGLAA